MRVRFLWWDWCDATADLFRFGVTWTFCTRSGPWKQPRKDLKKQQKSSSGSLHSGLCAHTKSRSHSNWHLIFTHACAVWMLLFFSPQIHNFHHLFQSNFTSYSHIFHPDFTHVETFYHLKHIFHDRGLLFLQNKSELMIWWVQMWTLKMVWGSELQRLLFTQA